MNTQCLPLIKALEKVPDFRHSRGKRYSLASILTLACIAIMCGYRSYSAIAEWGRNYNGNNELLLLLGFTKATTPCAATFHTIFCHIDWNTMEKVFHVWAESILGYNYDPILIEALALDGKTLRGSRKQGAVDSHLLSIVSHHLGITLIQRSVNEKTNEIPVALEVLMLVTLYGRVVTVDALLTQRKIAQAILDGNGDYIMIVKENQPHLLDAVQSVFTAGNDSFKEIATAETVDLGHGRIEHRVLKLCVGVGSISDWPGLNIAFQIERNTINKKTGKQTNEVEYGISSLSANRITPGIFLKLVRGHWTIENCSHYVRDVTYGEDLSQVRSGNVPKAMATLRNTAIGIMRAAGRLNIAAACREFAAKPLLALNLVGIAC